MGLLDTLHKIKKRLSLKDESLEVKMSKLLCWQYFPSKHKRQINYNNLSEHY